IDEAEHRFFSAMGFDVNGRAHLGIGDGFALASPTPDELYELARKAWRPDSSALLISCLNTNAHSVVDVLARELGCPVVTSTTATLWKLMRTAGIEFYLDGYGKLLTPGAASSERGYK